MRFNLKKPCKECPFLRANPLVGLGKARRKEIVDSITVADVPFQCHKTIRARKNIQHCAGAMIMLRKMDSANLAMRVAYTFKLFDPGQLQLDSPVYNTFEEFKNDTPFK